MRDDVEIVRVAERALLVRFPGLELGEAVRKAQAIFLEAKGERLSSKGKEEAALGSLVGKEASAEAKGERLSLKGKEEAVLGSLPGDEDSAEAKGERLSSKGKRRVVLGAGSLLVTLESDAAECELDDLRAELEVRAARPIGDSFLAGVCSQHRIEVRYGGEDGPDLAAVALETGLSAERVVELHASAEYTVAFVGFAPGFPYLIGLPAELEVPRLESPRVRVAAGSVAIAGLFSAVYPSATPGGWRLLGRTDAALFDPGAQSPARFAPGDRVRFVALA